MNIADLLPEFDYNDCLKRVNNNDKIVRMIVKKFNGTELLNQAKAAIDSGDMTNAAFHIHTLKGIAANISLTNVFELSRNVEAAIKNENKIAPEKIAELEEAIIAASKKIQMFLA